MSRVCKWALVAPSMTLFILAFQVAAQSGPAVQESRALRELPNATVAYYNVSGSDIRSLNDSILSQQEEQVSTSSATWDVGVSIKKRQVDRKCTIEGADAHFNATVRLPRWTNEKDARKDVRDAWHAYLKKLEDRQAADLWFVYDRVPQVTQAARASDCDHAGAAASAAIQRIKAEEAEFIRRTTAEASSR
jgi:predicted secreted Zn-dependent protease